MKWFHRRLGRRAALLGVAAAAALAALAVIGLSSGFATLSNSDFDAGDGNLVLADTDGTGPDTADVKDWANIGVNCTSNPKVGCALDLQRSQDDESFGQGTQENDAVPTITDGSIPNNKSDLTRFYVAGESGTDNHTLLYLGWERVQEPQGTTNMDFELNQNACGTPDTTDVEHCSGNGVTPERKAGDVLITYDLSKGGTHPSLAFHVWTTTGTDSSLCEQNGQKPGGGGKKPPCWGPEQSLGGDGEASINGVSVDDPINPNATRTLDPHTFGEAAVDLTGAGLVSPTECAPFASAYLKSKSSDSFTSEIKDFVRPVPLTLDTCGAITVRKQDDAGNAVGGVTFNLFRDNGTTTATTGPPDGPNGAHQDAPGAEDTAAGSCTTATSTAGGATIGECTVEDLQPGNYWVVEDTSTLPSGIGAGDTIKYVTVPTSQTVTVTFTDPRLHKVIVLVCHERTNTLIASDVTNGSTTKTTLDSGVTLPDGVSEAELCGLGGASFGGKSHLTDDDYKVDIGQVNGTPHN